MLKHGFAKCGTCHVDPSGGETLNHMGRIQSQTLLSSLWTTPAAAGAESKLLFGVDEPESVWLGGSFRFMSIYTVENSGVPADLASFPMQADVYANLELNWLMAGVSLGYADIPAGSPHLRAAQVTSGKDGPQLISRWHWLGAELDRGIVPRG